MRVATLCLLALVQAALIFPAAALAKDLCVHTTARGGWTFVLKKASPKPGNSGAVSGHAIGDAGTAAPISGGYVVSPNLLQLGITLYGTVLTLTSGTSTDTTTTFHQLVATLDGMTLSGFDLSWTREVNATITTATGDTQLVDCAAVPTIPKRF